MRSNCLALFLIGVLFPATLAGLLDLGDDDHHDHDGLQLDAAADVLVRLGDHGKKLVHDRKPRSNSHPMLPPVGGCGPNEVFSTCGRPWELTCDDLEPKKNYLQKYCVIRCQCKDGYVRNRKGRCVKPCEC